MACCCGPSCECNDKQWIVTLSGHQDHFVGGQKYGIAEGACLNGAYVFPFSGGGVVLCSSGIYGSGFDLPVGTKFGQRQRILLISTFGCDGQQFGLSFRLGASSTWLDGDPQPSNWGTLNIISGQGFTGSRGGTISSGTYSCAASFDQSYTMTRGDLGWLPTPAFVNDATPGYGYSNSVGTPAVRIQLV